MDWCILSTLGKKCYDHAKKVIYIYEKCFDDVLATSCYNPLAHRAKVAKSCYSFEGAREHSMLNRVPLLPLLFLVKICSLIYAWSMLKDFCWYQILYQNLLCLLLLAHGRNQNIAESDIRFAICKKTLIPL